MYDAGKLNEVQSAFFQPQGPEALYDLATDPYETHNLAGRAAYRKILQNMRKRLCAHMTAQCDLGMYPECVWLQAGKDNPSAFGLAHKQRIRRYLEIAGWQL